MRHRNRSVAATTGSEPDGQDCTEGCPYPLGTMVTLTATLEARANTVAWDGCDRAEGTKCDVTMSEDRAVSATFTSQVE